MNSNVGCFRKQPLVQFIVMPKLIKAPRTDEVAYIFYNYKVIHEPLFQSSHLQSHFSKSNLVICHSLAHISFNKYLLIGLEAQFSIFFM